MPEGMLNIEIKGLSTLANKLKASTRSDVIRKSLFEGAVLLRDWSKKHRLTGPRPRYLGVVTGRLRSSITAGKAIKRGSAYMSTIGTNVIYARTHEFGRGNIPARPFLSPSLKDRKNQESVLKIFVNNINQAIRRAR